MNLYPRGSSYFEEEEVELVSELLDRGFPDDQVVAAVIEHMQPFPKRNAHHYRLRAKNHVLAIKADRWNWNTGRDPLAMQRAFEGSKAEWDALNHYERREVVIRLQYLLDNDIQHPKFPGLAIKGGGLAAWCEAVGVEESDNITKPFGRRYRTTGKQHA